MNTNFISNNKFNTLLFLLLYFSLIIGFAYDENALGGSIGDYLNQKKISAKFANDFYHTFLNYNKETLFCTFEMESGVQFAQFLPDVIMQDPIWAQRYGYESSYMITEIMSQLMAIV